jgi:hypothetical protein
MRIKGREEPRSELAKNRRVYNPHAGTSPVSLVTNLLQKAACLAARSSDRNLPST